MLIKTGKNFEPTMQRIESKEDLVKWAKAINSGVYPLEATTWIFQDIYAHSNHDDLGRFFVEADGERMLILCSIHNVMHHDEIEFMLKKLAIHKANKEMEYYYAEFEKKEAVLASRERAFKDSMKPYHKRLETLRRQYIPLENTLNFLKIREKDLVEENRALRHQLAEAQDKASKYDTIKSLLA